jgi:hypothetical protein
MATLVVKDTFAHMFTSDGMDLTEIFLIVGPVLGLVVIISFSVMQAWQNVKRHDSELQDSINRLREHEHRMIQLQAQLEDEEIMGPTRSLKNSIIHYYQDIKED